MAIRKGILEEKMECFHFMEKFVNIYLSCSVTVFGESAGGASATYLMMSPLAKGIIVRCAELNATVDNFVVDLLVAFMFVVSFNLNHRSIKIDLFEIESTEIDFVF